MYGSLHGPARLAIYIMISPHIMAQNILTVVCFQLTTKICSQGCTIRLVLQPQPSTQFDLREQLRSVPFHAQKSIALQSQSWCRAVQSAARDFNKGIVSVSWRQQSIWALSATGCVPLSALVKYVAVCVRVCWYCHQTGGTDVVDLPDILLPAGQYLDMFDSESETDVPSDSSDEELVEV